MEIGVSTSSGGWVLERISRREYAGARGGCAFGRCETSGKPVGRSDRSVRVVDPKFDEHPDGLGRRSGTGQVLFSSLKNRCNRLGNFDG